MNVEEETDEIIGFFKDDIDFRGFQKIEIEE